MSLKLSLRNLLPIRGNVRILIIQTLIFNTGLNLFYVAWQPFVLFLGASVTILGVLQSLGWLSLTILQPFFGKISDRIGRKKPMIMGAGLSVVALIIFTITSAMAKIWYLLIPAIIFWGTSSAISQPAWDALLAESVEKKERGTAMGLITGLGQATGIYAPIIAGLLHGYFGYQIIFLIFLICGALNFALIFLLKETHRGRRKRFLTKNDIRSIFKTIFIPERKLIGFFLFVVVNQLAWWITWPIFYGMLTKEFGFTVPQIGYLYVILSLSSLLLVIPLGKMIDKYGRKTILLITQIMGCFALIGYIFFHQFEAFLILQIPWTITFITWVPATFAWLADEVPAKRRGQAMGRLYAFRALGSSPAPIIGGLLFDNFGFNTPIMTNLFLVIASLLIATIFIRETR